MTLASFSVRTASWTKGPELFRDLTKKMKQVLIGQADDPGDDDKIEAHTVDLWVEDRKVWQM